MKTKTTDKVYQGSLVKWVAYYNQRIYRVLAFDPVYEVVKMIYIGNLYGGRFTPFLGKTKPVYKELSCYVKPCILIEE